MSTYQEILGYAPSEYQTRIFDFVVHGHGNGVIKARAGSGKTKTLTTCMKLLPEQKRCLFLAFNKSVKDGIAASLANHPNCTVKTVHGLGYGIMSSHTHSGIRINDYKYNTYLRNNIKSLSTAFVKGKNRFGSYIDRILALLKFSRMDLAQSVREIRDVAARHSIDIEYDEDSVVKKLMDWGKTDLSSMDYTDLVWLPNELDVIVPAYDKYDWIFNDEAQDYTIAYVSLFMKCFKRGTRFISCGDEFQSINQFTGASEKAFGMMTEHANTTIFDLPISYRCDTSIIAEAQKIVPDIQARDGAGAGMLVESSHISDITGDDMVLCRTNAPLFKMYAKLIRLGKPCYIKGLDADKEKLVKYINSYAANEFLGKGFSRDGLFPRLYKELVDERNRLVETGIDMIDAMSAPSVQNLYDIIATLDTVSVNCDTVEQLKAKLDRIFSSTETGICLTTIHKAKGLEADNVHILCRSELPSKLATTEQEIRAEENLLYVAITRARHKLTYVSEKEFPPFLIFANTDDILTEFDYIEKSVCKMFGGKPMSKSKKSGKTAKDKARSGKADTIVPIHANDNRKTIKEGKKKNNLIGKLLE